MKCAINTVLTTSLVVLACISLRPSALTADPPKAAGAAVLAQSETSPATNHTAPPNIVIPDPLFTFEPVVDGSQVVHDFQVYNRGAGALDIEKIETG